MIISVHFCSKCQNGFARAALKKGLCAACRGETPPERCAHGTQPPSACVHCSRITQVAPAFKEGLGR